MIWSFENQFGYFFVANSIGHFVFHINYRNNHKHNTYKVITKLTGYNGAGGFDVMTAISFAVTFVLVLI